MISEIMEDFIWGKSRTMAVVRQQVLWIAEREIEVLLLGETGTGKGLLARMIHAQSCRASNPFVPVNVAEIPRDLLASELFGYEKGAFTGAVNRKTGLFESAHNGTLFLDEVEAIPSTVQVSLLNVIEEKHFRRIGGIDRIRSNFRLIAATNVDLERLVKDGLFRGDLYYRIEKFKIELPPLRDQPEDVPLLIEYFLTHQIEPSGRKLRFSSEALRYLKDYTWPGNVRELKNLVERLEVLHNGEVTLKHVMEMLAPGIEVLPRWKDAKTKFERELLQRAWSLCRGNKHQMAKQLGLPRSTLRDLLRRYDLEHPTEGKREAKIRPLS